MPSSAALLTMGAPQPDRFARQRAEVASGLPDLDRLISRHVRKYLRCLRSWPSDLQGHAAGGLAQPDMLFERRCAKRSAAANGPVDRSRIAARGIHGDLDP